MAVASLPPQKGASASAQTPLLSWLMPGLRSTIGSKMLVAVTGLMLIGFLFGHMAGNLLIYKGQDALNRYARGLKDLGGLLWVARGGLLVAFVVHIALAVRLQLRNRGARPEGYQFNNTVQASLASRTMLLTGLLILAFVIYHLLHFTGGAIHSAGNGKNLLTLEQPYWDDGIVKERHDVYSMVIDGFSRPIVAFSYIIAQLVLGMHLSHGISSVFQTLGWNAPRYWGAIRNLGLAMTAILVLGNISIPLSVLWGLVK